MKNETNDAHKAKIRINNFPPEEKMDAYFPYINPYNLTELFLVRIFCSKENSILRDFLY